MGASTTEEITLMISTPTKDDEGEGQKTKPAGEAENHPVNKLPIHLKAVLAFFRRFRKYLQDDCLSLCKKAPTSKEADNCDEQTKRERVAYKRLMADMGNEPTDESPFNLLMWIVHALILLVFIVFLVTTWNVGRINHRKFLHLRAHSWVALLMVLVSGMPVVRFATYAASESLVWLRIHHKYTVYLARKLKKDVDFTLWSVTLLWVWYTFFRPQIIQDARGAEKLDASKEEYKHVLKVVVKQITRFLLAMTIGGAIWTAKTLIFYRLLADLHFGKLCKRIRYAILHLHVIQFVEKKGYWNFLTNTSRQSNSNDNSAKAKKPDDSEVISFWMAVSHLRKETAPTWILKRLNYTYLLHLRNKPNILQELEATNDDQELLNVAKKLFDMVIEGREDHERAITKDDLNKYGLEGREIEHVFELFANRLGRKREQLQKITQDDFLRWVVFAVKNCLGLERIVESSRRIFWKLDLLMSTLAISLVLVIWLLLSEAVSTAQLAILFTPIISASFIFGKSLREIFDGLIFVFGMHPFDLDDRVIVDGIAMKVKKLHILSTVFIKYDTGAEAIYPNSELSTKNIVNLDITPDQSDFIEFPLPLGTPEELILDLQLNLKKNLDDNLTYSSDTAVTKKQISDKEITMNVHFKYMVSYFSAETRADHRSRILTLIIKLRNELEKATQSEQKEYSPPLTEPETLQFQIDNKMKLPKIDDLKNQIMCVLGRHDKSLKDCSRVLFTGIDNDKITMEVRMRYRDGLFAARTLELIKSEVEEAIRQKAAEFFFWCEWKKKTAA